MTALARGASEFQAAFDKPPPIRKQLSIEAEELRKTMKMKRAFNSTVIVIFLVLFWRCEATAECISKTPEMALEEAVAVFSGTAVAVGPSEVEFNVVQVWKGPEQKRMVLSQRSDVISSTEIHFVQGEQYLIFAKTLSPLSVSGCGGTRRMSDAPRHWLKILGPGKEIK